MTMGRRIGQVGVLILIVGSTHGHGWILAVEMCIVLHLTFLGPERLDVEMV